ncbi:MAG: peroxide stress protein YaaA [Micrococcales bacterium]|nr:peroxide stress protein YaaA [Actinomycetota bacterium]NCA07715.1 peroxide stress protein YaaA [Micrococcales bacterium]
MLLLLPPSETKRIGGSNLTIEQVHLSYGQLNEARDLVLGDLLKLCKNKAEAARVLKLSPKQLGEIDLNLAIRTAPTLPAYQRYEGTLYKAIDTASFTSHEVEQMRAHVLMQSALFGLISATDRIPWYRLSAGTVLPKVSLNKIWKEHQDSAWERLVDFPIIDLRSKAYVDIAPVPEEIESYWVEVVAEDSKGQKKALNHFNKTAKGELVGAFVRAKTAPRTITQLKAVAKKAGLGLEVNGKTLYLITTEVIRPK